MLKYNYLNNMNLSANTASFKKIVIQILKQLICFKNKKINK